MGVLLTAINNQTGDCTCCCAGNQYVLLACQEQISDIIVHSEANVAQSGTIYDFVMQGTNPTFLKFQGTEDTIKYTTDFKKTGCKVEGTSTLEMNYNCSDELARFYTDELKECCYLVAIIVRCESEYADVAGLQIYKPYADSNVKYLKPEINITSDSGLGGEAKDERTSTLKITFQQPCPVLIPMSRVDLIPVTQ